MKKLRLILGIISIVLFPIINFYSCAFMVESAIEEGAESSRETPFIIFSLFIAIAGITAICTRKSIVGGITTGCLYIIAGLIGLTNTGIYEPLRIFSVFTFICAFTFVLTSIIMIIKKKSKKNHIPVD